MRRILLLLAFFNTFVFGAIDECKTDVYFGNGILTRQQDAKDNAFLLEDAIKQKLGSLKSFNKRIGKVSYAYNKTEGMGNDLLESALQKLDWDWLTDYFSPSHKRDVTTQVNQYEASIRLGHRVLVVAHSQGNLFAYDAYRALKERGKDGWMQQYFEAVSIASPMKADIKTGTPRIDWDNDTVPHIWTSGDHSANDIPNNVRLIDWVKIGGNPGEEDGGQQTSPILLDQRYTTKDNIGQTRSFGLDETYKAQEGGMDTNVHAFTFYMGKLLKDGHSGMLFVDPFGNPFAEANLADSTAKTEIMTAIQTQLDKLEKVSSQWEAKNLGCTCKEKYAKLTHKFEKDTFKFPQEKVKDFAENQKGKIYQVAGTYVRATCGGEQIEEIEEGEACLALFKGEESLGEITGLKTTPKTQAGVVEVTAEWSKPELDYDLVVQWDAGELDVKDTGCGLEHYYISSEKVIYPGKYPVWIIPKDPADPIWDDPDTYPHTFSATITTPGKGADAQWSATATIGSKAALLQFKHIADIKVYRTGDDPDDDPDDDSDGVPNNSPIQFVPVVPPECPPVTVTPPTVEPRPVYSGGGGWGGLWCRDLGSGNCWELGWYWNDNNFGTGGTSIPIQQDPTCGGTPGCIPKPQDDPDHPNDPDTPFGSPPPEAGGTPPRDFNETNECSGDYSCYCIPCEYKIIPYLKQIYFGPLQDANYTIYSLEGYREDIPIYKGQTTHGEGLYDSGEIEIPQAVLERFEDDRYYIIEAVGGEDIDADDNFIPDTHPTPNKGKIYAIATGKEIKYVGFKVNILTTVSYTLTRELIEGDATPEQIGAKLADIASRLLRYKLYPDKTQKSITNTDILVWLPTTDQDVLLKSYIPLKNMAEKIYRNESIYEDAVAYVYPTEESTESNSTEPPIIRSFSGSIEENATGGTVVGQIEILRGGDDVVFGALSGDDAEHFEVSTTGEIRLRADATLDYESRWLYILKADAHNSYGSSGKVSVFISIKDIVDAPKFIELEGGSVEENATAGTVVGRLLYDQGAAPIERITLSGTSKDLFVVSSDGTIRLAEGAVLDYEKVRYYGLIAQATNSYGVSIPTILYLYVKDIADAPKITGYTGGYVSESAVAGTTIGVLTFDQGGADVTEASLSGTGAESFSIDTNGTVRLAEGAVIDYEQYNFYRITATLGNSYGEDTYPIFVSIKDAVDVPSYLSFEGGNVDENSPVGTLVGKVRYSPGASPIDSMALSGADADYFAIDLEGNITLKKTVDYEQKHDFVVYVTASNAVGESQKLTLHLFVNDLPEQTAVLDDTVFNDVEENLTIGSRLGNVHILYEGSGEIEMFTLSGEGADAFDIDREGNVTIAATLDFESKPIYNLQLKARNGAGYSREVNLIIRLKDIVDTPPRLKSLTVSTGEDTPIGTQLATIEVLSQGDTPILSYVLSGAGSDMFRVDSNGTIYLESALDYEVQRTYQLQLVAINSYGESSPVMIYITVGDIPDTPPELAETTLRIDENSPVGTTVGNVRIISHGDTPISHFEITGTGSRYFTIDTNGTIRIAADAVLDYEHMTHYEMQVKAFNIVGASREVICTVWVNDVADTVPILRNLQLYVDENTTEGTTVGEVGFVYGGSTVTSYRLTGDGNRLFAVDASGSIQLADVLDYEVQRTYQLQLVAINSYGESSPVMIYITVGDIPDTPPELAETTLRIDENSPVGTTVGSIMVVDKGDRPIDTFVLTGEGSKNFDIDENGTIKVAHGASLDYEQTTHYSLQVKAHSASGYSNEVRCTIWVDNIPDMLPVLSYTPIQTIDENETASIIIGKVSVTHSDTPILSMSLSGVGSEKFVIDSNGTLKTKKNTGFDYESEPSYVLYVLATSAAGDSEPLKIDISIGDVEEAPKLSPFSATIDENATAGTIVGNVTIIHHGDSPIVSIVLSGTGSTNFTIDTNGTIRVSESTMLDYETEDTYRLKAVATNQNGHSSQYAYSEYVRIDLNNIPDEPIIELDGAYAVEENATEGTPIGTIHIVRNGDSEIDYFEFPYSYENGIKIDTNGTITVGADTILDYETRKSFGFSVLAVNRNGNKSNRIYVSVSVNNIPDEPILASSQEFSVDENATVDTVIGKLEILDEGDTPIIVYEMIYKSDIFDIDNNGTIFVKNNTSLDYEHSRAHSLYIRAKNASGKYSKQVSVYINVNNIPDEPVVPESTFSIEENATAGTIVGELNISSTGDSPIVSIELPSYYTNFTIDNNGTIRVSDDAHLNYEKEKDHYLNYIKVINETGNVISTSVTIHLINIPDEPVLGKIYCSIEEHQPIGTKVCKLDIVEEGDSPIVSMAFVNYRGDPIDTPFSIDKNGTISVRDSDALDYERKSYYELFASATNESGKKSYTAYEEYYYYKPGAVRISVINDPDDTPKLERKTIYVKENSSVGMIVGNVLMNEGKASIDSATVYKTHYQTYGNPASEDVSTLFQIDINGSIRIKAPLDYEKNFKPCQNNADTQRYCEYINITMTNRYGSTTLYKQEIEIGDVPDDPAVLKPAHFEVAEDIPVGSIIGQIDVIASGQGEILHFDIHGDNSLFGIDKNGTVTLLQPLDYETKQQYELNVTADNGYTVSKSILVKIDVLNVVDEVPKLKDFTGKLSENSPTDTIVGSIPVIYVGDSPIQNIILKGKGSEDFTIDTNGTLRVAAGTSIDYEALSSYSLTAIANNKAGDSDPVNIKISIDNIPEIILVDFNGTIEENSPKGTEVGKVAIDMAEVTIERISLTGEGSENFDIDINGTLYVSADAAINYEVTSQYHLRATAIGMAVRSNEVNVSISVKDIPESPPSIGYFNGNVNENSEAGTRVGDVPIKSESTVTNISLSGTGSGYFMIDINGTIWVAEGAMLDYEKERYYNLTVHADNLDGSSSKAITIGINNIADTPPNISGPWRPLIVEEEQNSSKEVGRSREIYIWSDSSVDSVRLEGDGAEDFTIDTQGHIRIASGVTIDRSKYEQYVLMVIAENTFGESEHKEIIIDVHYNNYISPDTLSLDMKVQDIEKDEDNHTYVVGTIYNTPTIAKYDNEQNLMWLQQFEVAGNSNSWGIYNWKMKLHINSDGVYCSGEIGDYLENAAALQDKQRINTNSLFALAMDKNGTTQWIKQFGTPKDDSFINMVYKNQKLYIAANIGETVDLDNNASTLSSGVVYVLENNGTLDYIKQFDTMNDIDTLQVFEVDYNGTGFFMGGLLDNGINNMIATDTDIRENTSFNIEGRISDSSLISQDKDGNVYIASVIHELESSQSTVIVKKYASDGVFVWESSYILNDASQVERIYFHKNGFQLLIRSYDIGHILEIDNQGVLLEDKKYGFGESEIHLWIKDEKVYLVKDPRMGET